MLLTRTSGAPAGMLFVWFRLLPALPPSHTPTTIAANDNVDDCASNRISSASNSASASASGSHSDNNNDSNDDDDGEHFVCSVHMFATHACKSKDFVVLG